MLNLKMMTNNIESMNNDVISAITFFIDNHNVPLPIGKKFPLLFIIAIVGTTFVKNKLHRCCCNSIIEMMQAAVSIATIKIQNDINA